MAVLVIDILKVVWLQETGTSAGTVLPMIIGGMERLERVIPSIVGYVGKPFEQPGWR
jgi:hypothetical protein